VSARVEEPTRDQLQAMAYVDGELAQAERLTFEALLATRRDLQLEVAQLRKLEVLARSAAAPEPIDHEWKRLQREPLQRGSIGLGFAALGFGALGLTLFAGYSVFTSHLQLLPKQFLGALCVGVLLLFLATLRGRLRTLPFDPYTEIER
jgi:anti-sigma factor RsiW